MAKVTTRLPWMSAIAPEELPVIQELLSEPTDRGAAIVAVAIIDERFSVVLKPRFHHDPKVDGELFGTARPLSSLTAKADIAFAIGAISLFVNREVHILAEIRNKFAHYTLRSFSEQQIAAKCENLQFPKILTLTHYPGGDSVVPDTRSKFMYAVQGVLHALRMAIEATDCLPPKPPYDSPPQAYVRK